MRKPRLSLSLSLSLSLFRFQKPSILTTNVNQIKSKMQFNLTSLFVLASMTLTGAVAAAGTAATVAGICPDQAITAPDGRKLRFTGGGGSGKRGTEQDISFDIPAHVGSAVGLANVYLRNNDMKAYQVQGESITGAQFLPRQDSSAFERYIVPQSTPPGLYTLWANLRLKDGSTCTFGGKTTLTVLA